MRLATFTVFALYCALGTVARAAHPDFHPAWAIGESWQVDFSVLQSRNPKEPAPPQSSRSGAVSGPIGELPTSVAVVRYKYSVIDRAKRNGRTVATVLVEPNRLGFASWRLLFDANEVLLLRVEKLLSNGEIIAFDNLFGDESWMAYLNDYYLTIVLDFPKLPSADLDEQRLVNPAPDTSGIPFVQNLVFDTAAVTARLTRTDPVEQAEHRTTIVWQRGKRWWSSAVVTLAGEVKVAGKLVE